MPFQIICLVLCNVIVYTFEVVPHSIQCEKRLVKPTYIYIALDGNKPPQADAGPDVFVKLPNRAAALDGSSSTDDYGIVSYTWARDIKSPAAGVGSQLGFFYSSFAYAHIPSFLPHISLVSSFGSK